MSKCVICDKCGKVVKKHESAKLTGDDYRLDNIVFHLCGTCIKDLNKWMKDGDD